jgi:hypothetical protein
MTLANVGVSPECGIDPKTGPGRRFLHFGLSLTQDLEGCDIAS